ncbi:MAG: hypothetical protein OEX04_09335 [Acidimicrobiia bacterium]|nr:hypothetical protein [Acidimicrobiia bacterium]
MTRSHLAPVFIALTIVAACSSGEPGDYIAEACTHQRAFLQEANSPHDDTMAALDQDVETAASLGQEQSADQLADVAQAARDGDTQKVQEFIDRNCPPAP